jgi:hypothetical protein
MALFAISERSELARALRSSATPPVDRSRAIDVKMRGQSRPGIGNGVKCEIHARHMV